MYLQLGEDRNGRSEEADVYASGDAEKTTTFV